VGPQVAVGGQAPPPGRQLLAGPQVHQRGGVPRLLSARRRHRAARDGFRAAGAAASLRSPEGQAAPRRGRLPPGIDAGDFVPSRASPRWPTRP
jgi:hypothetical protein